MGAADASGAVGRLGLCRLQRLFALPFGDTGGDSSSNGNDMDTSMGDVDLAGGGAGGERWRWRWR